MEDGEIIGLYWARDQRAIGESDKKYGALCRNVAYGILRSREDSEECVSDTWLRTWDTIPTQRPGSLRAYCGKIVRNLALDRWDYNRAEKRAGHMTQLLGELEECVPSGTDGYAGVELGALLSDFLRAQEKRNRLLFLRRYWYADTIEELCGRFQMSQSAVKSSLLRTRRRLRAYLEKEGITIG